MAEQAELELGDEDQPKAEESTEKQVEEKEEVASPGERGEEAGAVPPAAGPELATLQAQLQAEREERIRAEAKAEAVAEGQKPKPLTAAQLQAAVDEGQINQAQMIEELNRQSRETLKAEIQAEMDQREAASREAMTVDTELNSYMSQVPGLIQAGSEDDLKAGAQFSQLRGMGFPDDKRTKLIACRLAFGEVKKLEERTRQRRETHKETGSPTARGDTSGPDRWEKGLRQPQIDALRNQLLRGVYKGTDDPFFHRVVKRARMSNE